MIRCTAPRWRRWVASAGEGVGPAPVSPESARAAREHQVLLESARKTLVGILIAVAVVVWVFRELALIVGYSVLLAYALRPVVKMLERMPWPRGRVLPRAVLAGLVMGSLVALAVWALSIALPRLAVEASHFVTQAPDILARSVAGLHDYVGRHGLGARLDPAIESARIDVLELTRNLGGILAQRAAGIFGGIGSLLGFALVPLLAFYLLAESDAVTMSFLRFVPEDAHAELSRLGDAVDRALRSYVRGQAIVCLVTGAAVGVGLALLHHPVALLLGLVAGVAELIPYLGFLVVAIAIALSGLGVSPLQALLGLAAYTLLNWTIGTLVTPRLMGRYLMMHPFVVTVSVLAGAQLLGPAGALLALPVSAVLQVIIGELSPGRVRAAKSEAAQGADS